MARNGSGTYNLPSGQPVVTGTTISSTTFNALTADIANALTTSVATDGQTAMAANLPMGGHKLTGLAAAAGAGESLRYEQLFSQGVEVALASAATTDIGAQNTNFLQVTGTTTITSFGTNYNGPRFIRFAGALTLTHNASTLILPGAANIATAAGDTCIAVPIGSPASGWQVLFYTRASTPVLGSVIDRAYAEYTANADLTTQIPADDTIPQNTEGTQIISVSFTPKSTTSRVRLRFSGEFTMAAAGTTAAALFSGASANALAARTKTVTAGSNREQLYVETEHVPGVTTAITYSVRVGPLTAVAARFNGTSAAREFGGTEVASLVIEEIAA